MAFFTVIIPVYKVEKYLQQCLESVLVQVFEDFEVIMVDDGSPDNCPQICDEFVLRDSRFNVIHKKNEGPEKARKIGVRNASGKYIIFVDGDDWIDKELLQYVYNNLKENAVDMVALGYIRELEKTSVCLLNKVKEGIYFKSELQKYVYPQMLCTENFFEFGIWPSVWSKAFRRELITEVVENVDDRLIMGEDAVCTYMCLNRAESLQVIDKCFYHYRYVSTSLSQKYDEKFFSKIERLFDFFDKKSDLDLGKQLDWYKMFLFLLGIEQKFLLQDKMVEAYCEIKEICKRESFAYTIAHFQCEHMESRQKFLVNSLKERSYWRLFLYYFLRRIRYNLMICLKWEKVKKNG